MRIIAGTSRGIPLKVPKDTTRPTTDRVRESIFSGLGAAVVDAAVLDLFAGSGSLGLECLSRGAKSALFVDESRNASQVIEANLAKIGLAPKGAVRTMKVARFLRHISPETQFDLIFADPPYAKDQENQNRLSEFLEDEKLPTLLGPGGLFILETSSRSLLPEMSGWTTVKEKTYGETRVTQLRPT